MNSIIFNLTFNYNANIMILVIENVPLFLNTESTNLVVLPEVKKVKMNRVYRKKEKLKQKLKNMCWFPH